MIDQIRRILAFDICLVLELYKQHGLHTIPDLSFNQNLGHSEVCHDSPPFPTANHSVFECLVNSTTKQISKARMCLIWSIFSQLAVLGPCAISSSSSSLVLCNHRDYQLSGGLGKFVLSVERFVVRLGKFVGSLRKFAVN
jgi:hypothetical protein